MISKKLDRKYHAYATLQLRDMKEPLKVRVPLWSDIKVEDDLLKFKTYHGNDAPVGEMIVPTSILVWWKLRWEPADE